MMQTKLTMKQIVFYIALTAVLCMAAGAMIAGLR